MELKVAVLGRNLQHSVSPALHEMLFSILKKKVNSEFDGVSYEKVECESEGDVMQWMASAATQGYHGANITAPFKELIARALHRQSAEARRVRSANTLIFQPSLDSQTTDGAGFIHALAKEDALEIEGMHLLLLGGGGAARAVLHSASKHFPAAVTVAMRDTSKAGRFGHIAKQARLVNLPEVRRSSGNYFVIQATPVGQLSEEEILPEFEWREGDIAVDLVYNPIRTTFLKRAAQAGARTISGLGMLIEQAALSQQYWLSGSLDQDSPLDLEEYESLKHRLNPMLQ